MRCFIAVDIDSQIKEKILLLQNLLSELKAKIKLVEPENLHFTIKFIGDVNDEEIDEVQNSLSNCLREVHEFTVNMGGIGCFGCEERVKIIWVGLNKGRDDMVKLMKSVNNNVKFGESGVSPHITIARVRSPLSKRDIIEAVKESSHMNLCEMAVKYVKLKSSCLTSKGPIYSDLKIFELGGKHE